MIELDYMKLDEVSDELLAAYIDGNVSYVEKNFVEENIKDNEELMEIIDIGTELNQIPEQSWEANDSNLFSSADSLSFSSDELNFENEFEQETYDDNIDIYESATDDSTMSMFDDLESSDETLDSINESCDSDIDANETDDIDY